MLGFDQWAHRLEDFIPQDALCFGIGVNGIGLHQVWNIPYPFQKPIDQDYTQLLSDSRVDPFKYFGKSLAVVRRHLHPQKNGDSSRLPANLNNVPEISIHFSDADSSEAVVTPQLDNHNIWCVFFNQSGKPHQTSCRRVSRNPRIDYLIPASGNRSPQKGDPALSNIRQAVTCTDTVPENQKRRSPDRDGKETQNCDQKNSEHEKHD